MPLSGTERLFWAAGILGHSVLLGVLFWKGRAARFPFFTALILSSILRTVLLLAFLSHEDLYLVVFLGGNVLDCLLQLAVTYEVAANTFRPLGRWAPDTRRAILFLLCASLVLGLGMTMLASPAKPDPLMNLTLKGNFFASVLQTELFLGMVVLATTVGLPWKTHVARIAYGLGGYSLVGVLVGAGFTVYDKMTHLPTREGIIYTRQSLYLLCVVYWIVMLWMDAPPPRELPPQLSERLRSLNARVAYDLYTFRSGRKF